MRAICDLTSMCWATTLAVFFLSQSVGIVLTGGS